MREFWLMPVVLWAATGVCACGGGDGGDTGGDGGEEVTGPIARFEPTASGAMDWDAIPFPNDLHLGEDGTVDLASVPTDSPVWETARDKLGLRDGFCLTCGAWFPIEGAIDPDTLPADQALGDEPSPSDPIVIVEVDPDTPERTVEPLAARWVGRYSSVVVRPVGALEPGRTYAVALTSDLAGPEGLPLEPDDAFVPLRDGGEGGPGVERSRTLYEPALDELEAAGVERSRIAGLAVFTTDTPAENPMALARVAREAPAPTAEVEKIWLRDDGGLDLLMGVPDPDVHRPGLDVPPAPGTEGTRAVWHETTLAVVYGSFESPRVVEGSGTEVGARILGDDGLPAAGDVTERVPFLLIVPDVPLDGLPVIVWVGGLATGLDTGALLADTAGRAGVAVLAVEPFQHGSRATTAKDEGYGLRGNMFIPSGETEPDGLMYHEDADVVFRVYGVHDGAGEQKGSPEFLLAAVSQMVVDAHMALRLAREGDVTAIAEADPSLADLRFDPAATFYAGGSQGALVGASVTVGDEHLAGSILNVGAGAGGDFVCTPAGPLETVGFILQPLLDLRGAPSDGPCFHPNVMLYQWYIEPADSLPLAPALERARLATGSPPDLLVQTAEGDVFLPPPTQARWLRFAGVPASGDYPDAVPTASLPATDNVTEGGEAVTAAAYQFPDAAHNMLARRDSTLGGSFTNPVEDVHAQITHFLESRLDTGSAEIIAP